MRGRRKERWANGRRKRVDRESGTARGRERGEGRSCAYVRREMERDGADARGGIPCGRWEEGGGEGEERRMGSRRRGEKKGVKNIGAEETGGKNRAVSTEVAGGVEGVRAGER